MSIEQLWDAQRWEASVDATLDVLEARVGSGMRVGNGMSVDGGRSIAVTRPLTVSLYGSAEVALAVIEAVQTRPALRDALSFVAFVSSSPYRKAQGLYGLPWETSDWLAANPTDIVLNTSESSRAAISLTLAALGLADRTVEVFGDVFRLVA